MTCRKPKRKGPKPKKLKMTPELELAMIRGSMDLIALRLGFMSWRKLEQLSRKGRGK